MCDAENKLVAWVDGELRAEEAASIERHLEACEECRGRVAEFRGVSENVDRYCDAVMAAKARPGVARWTVPVLAFAAAAAILLFVAVTRSRVAPPPASAPKIADASAATNSPAAISAPIVRSQESSPSFGKLVQRKTTHPRRAMTPGRQVFSAEAANWQSSETAVQIAIPAEAMFPPGAMPKGLNFVAELSIGPDGSVRQVRLRQ